MYERIKWRSNLWHLVVDKKNGMAKLFNNGSNEPFNVINNEDVLIEELFISLLSMDGRELCWSIFLPVFLSLFAYAVIISMNCIYYIRPYGMLAPYEDC